MIIKETVDLTEIKSILFHDDIFDLARDDIEVSKKEFEPPISANVMYVGGYCDDEIFGLSCFHIFRDGLKFHPNVLKKFRLQYGRDFIKRSVDMIKCRLYIEIPNDRRDLFNFAKKLGFKIIDENLNKTEMMRFKQ